MRRLISLLLAFAAVWLGLASPADAFSSPATSVQAYAYAGHHRISETNVATPERGPPSSYGRGTHYDAVDDWSNGASARPNVPTPGSNYAYNDPGTLVRVARVTPTTQERVWVPDGGSGVFTKAGVAAKYGDDVVGDARSYVNLTKGGSIRNVGTNATHTEFAGNLKSGGWTSRASGDGAVQIFQKDGAKYVLRSKNSSGYPGWTADFTPAGLKGHALELRLGYTP